MTHTKKILLTLTFFLFLFNGIAQTKPGAKQTPKKKAPPKEINVWICTNPKDKTFHKRAGCSELSKCGGELKQIKSAAELKKWAKKKSCKHCASM